MEDLIETLKALEKGIDIERKHVKELHDFRLGILAVQSITGHIFEEHPEHAEFFIEFSGLTHDLLEDLEVVEYGEIHLLAQETAAKKRGSEWIVRHQVIIDDEIKEETNHDRRVIQLIHSFAEGIRELIDEYKDEFLEETDIQMREVFERLERLFHFYLEIFQDELRRLS